MWTPEKMPRSRCQITWYSSAAKPERKKSAPATRSREGGLKPPLACAGFWAEPRDRSNEGSVRPRDRLPAHLGDRPLQPALRLLHAAARAVLHPVAGAAHGRRDRAGREGG